MTIFRAKFNEEFEQQFGSEVRRWKPMTFKERLERKPFIVLEILVSIPLLFLILLYPLGIIVLLVAPDLLDPKAADHLFSVVACIWMSTVGTAVGYFLYAYQKSFVVVCYSNGIRYRYKAVAFDDVEMVQVGIPVTWMEKNFPMTSKLPNHAEQLSERRKTSLALRLRNDQYFVLNLVAVSISKKSLREFVDFMRERLPEAFSMENYLTTLDTFEI